MRAAIFVPLILVLAVIAGYFAFEQAKPAERPPLAADQLGYANLNTQFVRQRSNFAATFHRERFFVQKVRRDAAQHATRYVASLLRDGKAAGKSVTTSKPVANGTLRPWFDGIPASRAQIVPEKTAGVSRRNWRTKPMTVPVEVEITMNQATNDKRSFKVDTVITLQQTGATKMRAPTGYRVTKEKVKERAFKQLRGFKDPWMDTSTTIDVIGETARRNDIEVTARRARDRYPALRDRYQGLNDSKLIGIFIVENRQQSDQVIGEVGGAVQPGDTTLAFANSTGDIVIDAEKYDSVFSDKYLAVLQHELAHVATLKMLRNDIPTMILEGIGTYEEERVLREGTQFRTNIGLLDQAFTAGTANYQNVLKHEGNGFGNVTPKGGVQIAYLEGYATIGWMEETHGHDKTRRFLSLLLDDVEVGAAVQRVFGINTLVLQRNVTAWTKKETAQR